MFFECSREWEKCLYISARWSIFQIQPHIICYVWSPNYGWVLWKESWWEAKKGAQEWPSHQVKWTLKRSQARPLWLTNPPRPLTCTPMPTLWWPYGPPTGPCKYPSPSPKTSFTLLPLIARPLQVARNPSFKYLSLHVAGWWCLGRLQHTQREEDLHLRRPIQSPDPPPPIQKIYIII